MKLLAMMAALACAGAATTPATAQMTTRTTTVETPRGAERTTVVRTPMHTERERVVTRHTVVRTHRDNNSHAGYRRQRVCTVRYRDHRRVRVCRWR